jgi:hypothetical protein
MKIITTAIALALVSASAFGNPLCTAPETSCITVAGTTGSVTFTAVGGNALGVMSSGFDGNAMFNPAMGPSDIGKAAFGMMNFLTGAEVAAGMAAANFPIPSAPPNVPTESFTYQTTTTSSTDDLMATITWTELKANAPNGEPQLIGTAVITMSSGDSQFTGDFPMGGTGTLFVDFPLIQPGSPCDLTELATMTNCTVTMEMASFEGGDLTPGVPGVPEPMSSFMALGMAVCCLWGTYQLTRRERGQSAS